ncbi:MAG: MFS transporter [Acidobacteria bacterium]|nr:MFS transporter [Acidobacteriota bacterium]
MARDTSGSTAVVWSVAFTNFAMPFMASGVGVALPAIGREMGMSGAALGLFETLYLGTATALLLPAGRVSDAGDKNSLFTLGLSGFTAITLTLAVLPSVSLLLTFRVLQGACAALVAATNMAILTESVPRERLGRAMGLNVGAVYAGLAAGPFTAGAITTALGWRAVFALGGLLSVVAAGMSAATLPRRWVWPRLRFDWPGAVTSGAGLMLLIVGSATVGDSSLGWWLATGGVTLLAAFIGIERSASSPLLALSVLAGRPVFRRALTVQFLTYAGAMGTSLLFSLYVQVVRGWTAREAGWLLMIAPVLMATLAPAAGRAADRRRPQLLAALGVTLIFAGTVAAWLVSMTSSMALIVLSLIAHGLGFATFSSPNMTVIMGNAPRDRTAMASALAAQMRGLGMVCALMLITGFMSVNLGPAGVAAPHATRGLAATMWGALGVISLLALWALISAWRDAPVPREDS